MVLLVIDAQEGLVNHQLYHLDEFIQRVKQLIASARENRIEVIYVRHDDGEGQELTPGKAGFEIYHEFQAKQDEKIFDKDVNSAFKKTGLLEYLRGKEESELILVGLQSDYCIDASVKCAFEHGFKVFIPEYTNATIDNEFMSGEESYRYYNEFIWPHRYAQCVRFDEIMKKMQKKADESFYVK